MISARGVKRGISAFVDDQRGAATVELLFWIPFFLLLLFFIIDVSVFYWRYTTMWDVTRDAARQLSIGRFGALSADPNAPAYDNVEAYVRQQLGAGFDVRLEDGGTFDPLLRVRARPSELSIFNVFGAFAGNDWIVSEVRLHKEPY